LSQLSPEQREAEEAAIWIAEFREVLNAERKHNKYKAGSAFDQQRSAILNRALTLLTDPMRKLAAQALRESYKFTDWPAKKERKQEVKQRLTELDGLA
jgi:hypothetical protein